jgi:hypothetical protein
MPPILENDNPMKLPKESSRTALVLIHGIGIQNRFDFLSDVVRGLCGKKKRRGTNSSGATAEFVDDRNSPHPRFLGRGVPLTVTYRENETSPPNSRLVDAYEVYWAPLVKGSTSMFSVLAFIFRILARLLPWNWNMGQRPLRAQGRRFARWTFTAVYLTLGLALVATLFYWSVGAFVLATDRAWIIASRDDDYEKVDQEMNAFAIRSDSDRKYLESDDRDQRALIARNNEITDRYSDADAALAHPGSPDNAASAQERDIESTKPSNSIRDNEKMGTAGRLMAQPRWSVRVPKFVGRLVETGNFMRDSFLYLPLHRGTFADLNYVPNWPNPLEAIKALTWSGLLIGATFGILIWTVFFGSIRTLFSLLFGAMRRSGNKAFLLLANLAAIVGILVLADAVASYDPNSYFFAISVLLLRGAWGIASVILCDVIGDVEVYAQRNANSRKYVARSKVLDRAVENIHAFCQSDYDEIVIVGHSLGAVVGLEALRRVYNDFALTQFKTVEANNFSKIKAFVTAGSPLEKFSVFFAADAIRRQFDDLSTEIDDRIFTDSGAAGDHTIKWINCWNWMDVIGDPIETYEGAVDERVPTNSPLWSHSDYWYGPEFGVILARVLTVDASPQKVDPPASVAVVASVN